MIKAKVVSVTINEAIGGVTKLDLETYMNDKDWVDLNSFYETKPWNGKVVVIMTEEEYESLEEVNKALDSVSDGLRQSLLDEREKTKELEEENMSIKDRFKDLEEQLAQETDQLDIHPDGTFVFKKKRVLELEFETYIEEADRGE